MVPVSTILWHVHGRICDISTRFRLLHSSASMLTLSLVGLMARHP